MSITKQLFLTTAISIALHGVAHAQSSGSTANQGDAIEEITVTATRRETNLMDTAGGISVLSGDLIRERGLVNLTSFDSITPNLKIVDQQNQGMGAVQISMRGIVNSSFIEIGDPNVGFHVDGVYMSRPQAALNLLFDAQRMEINRGPQGTLYGRNSTVGSINVINNRPDSTGFDGRVTGEFGEYDNQVFSGMVNVPLIENKLAIRASAYWQERDTFYDLRTDDVLQLPQGLTLADSPYRQRFGEGLGDDGAGAIDQRAYRISAEWTPTERLSAYVSYEEFDNNSPIAPSTVRGSEYTAYLSTPHFTDQQIESLRAEVKYDFADKVEVKALYGDQNYEHEILVDLDAGTSRFSPERTNPLPGDILTFEQTFYDRAWRTDSESIEFTATSTYESPLQWLVGYFDFTENTFRNFWIDLPTNGSGIINFNQPDREATSDALFGRIDWAISDEFRLALGVRETDDQRIDTGVNRFSSFPGDGSVNAYGAPLFVDAAGVTDLQFLCNFNPAVGPCADAPPLDTNVTGVGGVGLRAPSLIDSFGAAPGSPIGQVHAGIVAATNPNATVFSDQIVSNDQLRAISSILSAGDEVALLGSASLFPRVFFTEQDFSYTDFTVTLDYSPRDTTLLYGTVSTGHKSGSQEIFYHPRLHTFINSIIEPEDLVSYEFGWKEEFRDIGLSLAASFFYMDYEDKQQSVFVDGGDLFCADTFGDFNGDGLLESFVAGLDFIPIFAVSAVNAQNGEVQPDGQVALTDAQIAAAISNCSQGSDGAGGPLADQPGMPNFLELMQINFGNATVAGFEFEYNWAITPNDRLQGYLTFNVENEISDPNADALPFDLIDSLACSDRVGGCPDITTVDGNELPFAPDITFRASYEHDFYLDSGAYFTAGADLTYNDDYYLSIWNTGCYESIRLGTQVCNNGDLQDSYALLDLRLRYTSRNENFFIEGYMTNAGDETYATGIIRPTNEDLVSPYTFNSPQMFGLRASYRF